MCERYCTNFTCGTWSLNFNVKLNTKSLLFTKKNSDISDKTVNLSVNDTVHMYMESSL